jgi:hypothetical protein
VLGLAWYVPAALRSTGHDEVVDGGDARVLERGDERLHGVHGLDHGLGHRETRKPDSDLRQQVGVVQEVPPRVRCVPHIREFTIARAH